MFQKLRRVSRIRDHGQETLSIAETDIEYTTFLPIDSSGLSSDGRRSLRTGILSTTESFQRGEYLVFTDDGVDGDFYRVDNIRETMVGLQEYRVTEYKSGNN